MRIFYAGQTEECMLKAIQDSLGDNEIVAWANWARTKELVHKYFPHAVYFETDPQKRNPFENSFPIDRNFLVRYSDLIYDLEFIAERSLSEDILNSKLKKDIYLYNIISDSFAHIKKTNPNVFVFLETPHHPRTFGYYIVAKALNIKTVILYKSSIGNYFSFMVDHKKGDERMLKLFENYTPSSDTILSDSSKVLIKKLSSDYKVAMPAAEKKVLARVSTTQLALKKIKELKTFRTLVQRSTLYFHKQKGVNQVKKAFEKFKVTFNPDCDYIFFAMHYQPERTTMPEGGYFANYWTILNLLSIGTPDHWTIYVKEHPSTFGRQALNNKFLRFRDVAYYNALNSIKKVKFIDEKTDPFLCIDNAKAVVTLTGTIGVEAIFRGKPVLNFGYPSYTGFEGIFKIESLDDLRVAVAKIKDRYEVDKKRLFFQLETLKANAVFLEGDKRFMEGLALVFKKILSSNFSGI